MKNSFFNFGISKLLSSRLSVCVAAATMSLCLSAAPVMATDTVSGNSPDETISGNTLSDNTVSDDSTSGVPDSSSNDDKTDNSSKDNKTDNSSNDKEPDNSSKDNTPDDSSKNTVSDNDTASQNSAKGPSFISELDGVPIITAKQKIDITGAFPSTGFIKKYTVEPRGYAKVTKKGILTGKRPGKITISAFSDTGEKVGEIERVVFVPKLSPMTATKRDEVIQAMDYLRGDSGYLVKPTGWSITSSLATIDPSTGQITVSSTGKHGKAIVTVYYGEGKGAAKYKAALSVNLPYLNKTKLTLENGTSKKLKLKNAPVNEPIIWSSSKEKVATVNDNGKIKAKKEGKCEITATVGGYSYTCKVTVTDKDDD